MLSVSDSTNYIENSAAASVAPNLTIDTSIGTLDGATVSLDTSIDSSDRLGILGQTGTSGTVDGLSWTYDTVQGVLSLSGSADAATYQAALQKVAYSNSSDVPVGGDRSIQFALGSNLANPENGHFYEFVEAPGISWSNARDAAAAKSYLGLGGYLTTVTSETENSFITTKLEGEGWLGASDAEEEGEWRWATGPEAGQQFWQGGPGGSSTNSLYNNWVAGVEPNDDEGEDYGHFISDGTWNDYPETIGKISGYVVEYGGLESDTAGQLTGTATVTVTPENDSPTGTFILQNSANATEGIAVSVSTDFSKSSISDADGIENATPTFQWQQSIEGSYVDIADATATSFIPDDAQVGRQLRLKVNYTDDQGTDEVTYSEPTSPVADVSVKLSHFGPTTVALPLSEFYSDASDLTVTVAGNTNSELLPEGSVTVSGEGDSRTLTLDSNIDLPQGEATVTLNLVNGDFSTTQSIDVALYNTSPDFDQDDFGDLLWVNEANGGLVQWSILELNEQLSSISRAFITGDDISASGFDVVDSFDFNNDGSSDILMRNNATDENKVLLLDGTQQIGTAIIGENLPIANQAWRMKAAGNFDSDAETEILWRNLETGGFVIWDMDSVNATPKFVDLTAIGRAAGDPLPLKWEMQATGDFSGDGKDQVLWRDTESGANALWTLDGTTLESSDFIPQMVDLEWDMIGASDFDFNGTVDIAWRNAGTGENMVWQLDRQGDSYVKTDMASIVGLTAPSWVAV